MKHTKLQIGNNYYYWNNEISHKICKKLIKLGKGKWDQAQTFGSRDEKQSLYNIRKSDIVWIEDQWVYDLIWNYMLAANERAGWKYDYTIIEILASNSGTCTYCITFTSNKLGETEQVASPTDCKSAV